MTKRISDATNPHGRQKRVSRLKAQREEDIRAKLRTSWYITTIHKIAEVAPTLDKEQVPAYRLQLDACMGMLKKCLPDLKQIEVAGHVHHSHEEATQDQLVGRLLEVGLDPDAVFRTLQ